MTETLTAEELAALGEPGEPAGETEPEPDEGQRRYQCPDCPNSYTDRSTLRRHRLTKHGRAGSSSSSSSAPPPSRPATAPRLPSGELDDPDRVVAEAVANTQGLAGILAAVGLPYLGVTLAGVETEQGQVIVRSRAVIAGELLLPHARRNARILAWLIRYNQVFKGGTLFDLAGSVGAATVVDAAGVAVLLQGGDPEQAQEAQHFVADTSIQAGPLNLQPIRLAIPDVIDYVRQVEAAQAAQLAAAAPARNGRSRRKKETTEPAGVEVVEGGVEGT